MSVRKPRSRNLTFEKTIGDQIMTFYSETEVRSLHAEFKVLKKYTDRLTFFDRVFGIIPFPFPEFDPKLSFFFQQEKKQAFEELFKGERNNPGLTEKKFSFGETFVFNIRPANSNSAVYSNYILSSFLSRTPVFSDWISKHTTTGKPLTTLLEDANSIVNQIEYQLQNENEKSFTHQCMAVFYKGYFDAFSSQVNGPGKKRKFTELFLYAEGIVYANYIRSLKSALQKTRMSADLPGSTHLDLAGKLELLNELGLIDFLRTRYAGLDPFSFENKLTEILCLLTDGEMQQKELILEFLNVMNRQRFPGSSKKQSVLLREKILHFTTGK